MNRLLGSWDRDTALSELRRSQRGHARSLQDLRARRPKLEDAYVCGVEETRQRATRIATDNVKYRSCDLITLELGQEGATILELRASVNALAFGEDLFCRSGICQHWAFSVKMAPIFWHRRMLADLSFLIGFPGAAGAISECRPFIRNPP
jgi:hypothetical protein